MTEISICEVGCTMLSECMDKWLCGDMNKVNKMLKEVDGKGSGQSRHTFSKTPFTPGIK